MSDLISLLRDCIGQITAEDQLLINLSGLGFLHLREELFKELTSNCEKQRCIDIVKNYISSVIKKEFSFSKDNSERLWKFLGEFYACNFTNSFKQSAPLILETSVTESSSTPLKLSSLTKSINEIGSAILKRGKKGILIVLFVLLRMRCGHYVAAAVAKTTVVALFRMQIWRN